MLLGNIILAIMFLIEAAHSINHRNRERTHCDNYNILGGI